MSLLSPVLAGPRLTLRALDDLHRLARVGSSIDRLTEQLADVDRRLAAIEGFDRDLDRLGAAARELTGTMVLLRRTAENLTLAFPGSQLVARRAGRRRAREAPGDQG